MHELGVTESIIGIVLDKANEAGATRITGISLVVGELSGFVPDCIQFYFDLLSRDSIAAGASLHFESTPAQLRCRSCSTLFQPKDGSSGCPECGSGGVEVAGGRELYVKSMEVE
jgi:hydrogenase nickel incorporation protein HypA/HybF